jgi:hypothetical protein
MQVSGQLQAPAALPPGKDPLVSLDRRLGGPQSRSGRGGEEKNSQPRRESNPRTPIVQPVAQCYTDWAITALNLMFFLTKTCNLKATEISINSLQITRHSLTKFC